MSWHSWSQKNGMRETAPSATLALAEHGTLAAQSSFQLYFDCLSVLPTVQLCLLFLDEHVPGGAQGFWLQRGSPRPKVTVCPEQGALGPVCGDDVTLFPRAVSVIWYVGTWRKGWPPLRRFQACACMCLCIWVFVLVGGANEYEGVQVVWSMQSEGLSSVGGRGPPRSYLKEIQKGRLFVSVGGFIWAALSFQKLGCTGSRASQWQRPDNPRGTAAQCPL